MSKKLNKKLWSIHNWVGLYAGVVIAVLSITGVIALFKVQIDETLNEQYFKIDEPIQSNKLNPNVNKLIDSLKIEYGASRFSLVKPYLDTSKNWYVVFNVPKGKIPGNGSQFQIFFNPYTAKIVGKRDYFKTFGHYIRHIHVRLFIGLLGRFFVGFFGLALLISTITGILIYGGFMKRQFFGAIRTKNLKLKSADYHKMIGMTTLLFNLMISITGTWLGLEYLLKPVLQVTSPDRYSRVEKPITKEEDVAHYVDYIKAFEVSIKLFPDLIPKRITSSNNGSQTISIRGDVPKTAYQNRVNFITIDKKSYKELGRYDVRQAPLGDKVYYTQEGLHYGDFGGILVKIIYSFFGLTSGVLSVLGFVLYLERTKSKQKKKNKYKSAIKKVGSWFIWTIGICVLLYIFTITIGVIIPSLAITLGLYGCLLFFLIRFLVLFSKRLLKKVFVKT